MTDQPTLSALRKLGQPVKAGRVSRSLDKMHQEYAWDAVVAKGGFAYDTLRDWANTAESLRTAVLNTLDACLRRGEIDAGFYAAERDFAVLIGQCWRAPGFGSLVQSHPFRISNPDQAAALREELRKKGRYYQKRVMAMPLSQLRQIWETADIPTNRGKGWSTYLSGKHKQAAALIAAAIRGARTLAQRKARMVEAGAPQIEESIAVLRRIQSNPGEQPTWEPTPEGLAPLGKVKIKVKSRPVRLVPFDVNLDHAQAAAVLKFCLLTNPDQTTTGNVDAAAEAVQHYGSGFGLDVKRFDDSTGLQCIDSWAELILAPVLLVLEVRGVITTARRLRLMESFFSVNRMPMLFPSPFKDEAHRLLPHEGSVVSGLIYTSQMGSDIVDCLFRVEARAAGLLDYRFFNQGDDALFATRDAAAIQRIIAGGGRAGYRLTSTHEAAFLMSRLTTRGPTAYKYFSRMVDACLNREVMREPTTLTAYAAAMAIRYELLTGSPLQKYFYPVLLSVDNDRINAAVALARQFGALYLAQRAMREQSTEQMVANADQTEGLRELLARAGLDATPSVRAELDRYTLRSRAKISELEATPISSSEAIRLLYLLTRDNQ